LSSVVVTIRQEDGWHARPATDFARIVSDSGLQITVSRAGEEPVRGDSVLSLLTMGARFGEQLTITVSQEHSSQPNASQILQQLAELF
jgi:phosphocarrier protein